MSVESVIEDTECAIVDELVSRARKSQAAFEKNGSQEIYDTAALAAAWALMKPEHNETLSKMAVETTGLGKVEDKITKNHRKTLGLLRDIKDAPTYGVLSEDTEKGITKIARAIGVIGSVVPSTNPVATPTNNIVNALKCGNAIILSPSPKGAAVCERLLTYVHHELDGVGVDCDLVQMVPAPSSKVKTQRLMQTTDLLVVTGSQDNVRRAYSSGTPAIGVGAGNVTVIVDETAVLKDAAEKITASKTFDNATSCSSENVLIILDEIKEPFLQALHDSGARHVTGGEGEKLKSSLFQSGHLNRHMIARDINQVIEVADLNLDNMDGARFLLIDGKGVGPDYPESGEKLSLVATAYFARDFEHAKQVAAEVLRHQGAGHSIGIHTTRPDRAMQLGFEMPTCRVIVNQAHCFATGGSFDNGMPFSLSMGCGSWGGNSIDENLNYRHFFNTTKIVRTIEPVEPSLEEIFGEYWKKTEK
ncbi:MAG: aldehyde dehydrogenase family protein [Pseudomonadota bacterium]